MMDRQQPLKKIYATPASVIVELETEPLMSVLSGETSGAGVGNGTTDENDPDLSRRHRGEWGNLWK